MRDTRIVIAALGIAVGVQAGWLGRAEAAPKKKPDAAAPKTPAQKEADRHFKSGVALFKEAKYAEALAEFERAYEIAPHPLVLYNIAGCHRELSHYSEAVTYYRRFLAEGKDKVPAARLAAAQTELDGILARIARVTVSISPAASGVELTLDGAPLEQPTMPLILPPGEHKLSVHSAGHKDAERALHVASGDDLIVELQLQDLPPTPPPSPPVTELVSEPLPPPVAPPPPTRHHVALAVGFGTNLLQAGNTGAPALGLTGELGPVDLGVDAVFVAKAVMPSIAVRFAGDDALSFDAGAALPISLANGAMTQSFVAGAFGLGARYRPAANLAFRLATYASFAGKGHGFTLPTFLRGELWF